MAKNIRMKKCMALLFALLCWIQLAALPPVYAAGKTYYVDAVNGSDSNSGLSEQAAWKTAQKVAGTQFSAGDTILFHAGQTFYQVSIAPNCDSLTFGAYGDGARPVLSGGVPIGQWEVYGGNIYQQKIELENTPYLLKIGDKAYRRQATESYAQIDAGRFAYDEANGVLYVHEPAGIAAGLDMQVQQTNNIFYINAKKNIKIQGLSLMLTSSGVVDIQSGDSRNITVDNNEIAYGESFNNVAGGGINCSSSKFSTFSNNIIHDVYGDGIMLWRAEGNIISGNRIWGVRRGNNTGGDGIQSSGKAGNDAPDNQIIDNFVSMKDTDVGKGCIQQENGDNVYIARNICLYGSFGIESNSNYGVVENNICAYQGMQATQEDFNWTAGLYMSENEDITGMVWRGNIVAHVRSFGIRFIGSDENGSYKRTGFKVYNNTVYSDGPAFSAGVPFDGRIYNNIFYNYEEGRSGAAFAIGKVTEGQTVLSDNNIFYPERLGVISYNGDSYDSLQVYQELTGLDLQSYVEDPLLYGTKNGFSDLPEETDFTVFANSKAVSGGQSVKEGAEVVYPVGCNIGAVQTSRADEYPVKETPSDEVPKPPYQPGLLAYEGFAYRPTAALDGLDGGVGFDGAWRKGSSAAVSAAVGTSGLKKYPEIYVTGYKALLESEQERTVADPERFVNGTYYISFLYQGEIQFRFDSTAADGSAGGWLYVQNTKKRPWHICSNTDSKPKFANASAEHAEDTEGLVLIRLKITDTGTSAALWINPDLSGGEEGLGAPLLSDTATVRVVPETIQFKPADTSGKIQIDEIRIGNTFDAVLGQTSIYPETVAVTKVGLYDGAVLIGDAVSPDTAVQARVTLQNVSEEEREVALYAAAMDGGVLLDTCIGKYKIKAGMQEQVEFPITFSELAAQQYEVSLFVWDGLRPLCVQNRYIVE